MITIKETSMNGLTALKQALANSAEVPKALLDKIVYDGDNDDLLYEILFPILAWDSQNDYQSFDDGQFMEYMEWKEPYLNFDNFFMIKKRQLTINIDDIFDNYAQEVGDEDVMDEMDFLEACELHRQYCFNYFNKKLAPHQLRLIELGENDNAYFLLVNDDEKQIKELTHAFERFGISVILEQ